VGTVLAARGLWARGDGAFFVGGILLSFRNNSYILMASEIARHGRGEDSFGLVFFRATSPPDPKAEWRLVPIGEVKSSNSMACEWDEHGWWFGARSSHDSVVDT
jgi:hypothetical protein